MYDEVYLVKFNFCNGFCTFSKQIITTARYSTTFCICFDYKRKTRNAVRRSCVNNVTLLKVWSPDYAGKWRRGYEDKVPSHVQDVNRKKLEPIQKKPNTLLNDTREEVAGHVNT
ncbi:hypothetical protein RJT34_26269 [Clitoria ternatea]|uniref:Uncharacterized protein n=1 Tax=Clitoria ternatea TaxID=43366 RepID=A0AAN9IAE8_CLITE